MPLRVNKLFVFKLDKLNQHVALTCKSNLLVVARRFHVHLGCGGGQKLFDSVEILTSQSSILMLKASVFADSSAPTGEVEPPATPGDRFLECDPTWGAPFSFLLRGGKKGESKCVTQRFGRASESQCGSILYT